LRAILENPRLHGKSAEKIARRWLMARFDCASLVLIWGILRLRRGEILQGERRKFS
jgi:hypothetical protein